jgi:NDP-sugar pyrophosphorylase family protein
MFTGLSAFSVSRAGGSATGTAAGGGAVRLALAHCRTDPVLVLNGDTFLDLDLAALRACWQADRAPVVVARQVDDTTRFGRLQIEGDRILRFAEKGVAGPGPINAGVYLLPRDLQPRPQGRRNEPKYLPHILKAVAACRGERAEALAEATSGNALRFFGFEK